jgi:hypothetical protein
MPTVTTPKTEQEVIDFCEANKHQLRQRSRPRCGMVRSAKLCNGANSRYFFRGF